SLNLFKHLQEIGLKPDKFTFPVVLKVSSHCLMIETGGSLHSMAVKSGFGSDLHVNNTLLRMYAGFGVISNLPLDSLLLFQCMKLANENPNYVTLVSLLGACTCILNIRLGKGIHSHIVTSGIELHVELETTLLGMYAKCGHIQLAFRIFKSMGDKNLQTWTIMISGLTDHGHEEEVVSLFAIMEESGFRLDNLSFSAILYAYSHIGFVDAGREYFEKMASIYNIRPTMEHYGCMMEPNSLILRSFISACKHHGHIPCAEENIREILLKIEPDLGSNYVLASSLSYLFGYCSNANNLRLAMKAKGINKYPDSHLVVLPKEAVEGFDSNVSVYADRRGNSDHQD
ncbi:hypothetical protein H5410_001825, partial [Solanum commersonii]